MQLSFVSRRGTPVTLQIELEINVAAFVCVCVCLSPFSTALARPKLVQLFFLLYGYVDSHMTLDDFSWMD